MGEPTNRKRCGQVNICSCKENLADIREGLGPGGVTANEGVSGYLEEGTLKLRGAVNWQEKEREVGGIPSLSSG